MDFSICSKANTISTFSDQWKKGRFADYQWDKTIKVEVTTLEAVIQKHGVPKYCKIDVEGYEWEVLQGLKSLVPNLSFGYTIEFMDTAKRCVEHLQNLGYVYFNATIGEIRTNLPKRGYLERAFRSLDWPWRLHSCGETFMLNVTCNNDRRIWRN